MKHYLLPFVFITMVNATVPSSLVQSNGVLTNDVKTEFLTNKKQEMLSAISDSGFTIRQSTLSYIDNSSTLYNGIYGTLTKQDPHIILNIDSLLIQAENDNNSDFWSDRDEILLAAAVGRRGFGVSEVKGWERKLSINIKNLETARKEGKSFIEWHQDKYDAEIASRDARYSAFASLLSSIQDTIMSWVGNVSVVDIAQGPNIIGGKSAGILEDDMFTYAQVYGTDSLLEKIEIMVEDAGYTAGVNQALKDVRDIYSPTAAGVRAPVKPVYDYFRDLTKWQETPSSDLNWNPLSLQTSIDKMKHPIYDISTAPWPLLIPLSRSFQENEIQFIQENFLGYHKKVDASKSDTTDVYTPNIHQYGPYRSETTKWYLISYPIGGYVSEITGGGVCGTMSSIMQKVNTGLGRPVMKAGQPGHGNTVYYDQDSEGNNFAQIGQSVAAAEYTTSPNFLRDTELTWANGKYIHHLGLSYAMNIGEDSWIDSRIAYSIWKSMTDEEKRTLGIKMMTTVLSENPGYTEAVLALFRETIKESDVLFVETYDKIIGAINESITSVADNASLKQQYQIYRDLLTYTTLETAFTNSTLWSVESSNGLISWIQSFKLDAEPSSINNEYNKQHQRLWRISELTTTALGAFSNREVTDVRIDAPELKDSTFSESSDVNAERLIDGNSGTRYKVRTDKHTLDNEPYEFIFIFPEVHSVHTMRMTHNSINSNMLASEYELYWSSDSATWEGPLSGTFSLGKNQAVHFNADTTYIDANTVEVADSNGIVFDTAYVVADTIVTLKGVDMKYLKYIPKAAHVNDPFNGIIAQEFNFTYAPDLSGEITSVSSIVQPAFHLTGSSLIVTGESLQPIKLFNTGGQLVKKIYPNQMSGKIEYSFGGLNLGNQIYLVIFPQHLKLGSLKIRL